MTPSEHKDLVREAQLLGVLQGGVIAAAMTSRTCVVTAEEILTALSVTSGDDLEGCSAHDIGQLIESHVAIPRLHAAWQRARRQERGR